MKKLLILASLLLATSVSFAQTSTGFTVIPTVGVTDIRTNPTNSYNRDQHEPNTKLGAEVGYFGSEFGLTATIKSNFNLDREALIGGKLYANIIKVENMSIKGSFETATYVDRRQFRFIPGASLSIPLVSNIDAVFTGTGTFYNHDNWKVYPGGQFGIAFRL